MDSIDKSQLSPYQLRAMVLDYLAHSGYTNTACAFVQDSAIRHLDMDGEEVLQAESGAHQLSDSSLKQAELRNQIRLELLSGRVDDATSLLNKYFPSVLSLKDVDISSISSSHDMDYVASTSVHPAHLNLNLRIQSFIESCRTVPLEYPPLPAQSTPKPKPEEFSGDSSIIDHQTNLLNNAKKLYAYLRMLPSKQDIERHEMELQNVIGLLAYKIPEESTVSRYMEQSRRAAVAEQINSAILYHSKLTPISQLEYYIRYNSVVWSVLNELRVKPRPDASLPPTSDQKTSKLSGGQTCEVCPPFDMQEFLDSRS
ncbi:hypothetical protein VKT23_004263 [Stygiomarasmius scandens]|uniref:CRA domain-containing protein n=1 Tax=Marasmiellus scandens TaxID=2682957 RepID=A0ABR1JUF7_9AGAR